jgi:hypothetical protein
MGVSRVASRAARTVGQLNRTLAIKLGDAGETAYSSNSLERLMSIA